MIVLWLIARIPNFVEALTEEEKEKLAKIKKKMKRKVCNTWFAKSSSYALRISP